MDDRTPELEDVIRSAVDAQLLRVWTSLPARVVKFTHGTRPTVTCQPFPADFLDGEPVDLPVLAGVPVVYPQGKGGAIVWPLQPGDVVLVVFAARPLGRYRNEGTEGDPRLVRHHSLTDAWAIPLGAGNASVPGSSDTDAVWTAPTGGKIRLGGQAATKGVARVDDPVGSGALSLTCAAGGGGVVLSLAYTPPGGVPSVQTAIITGALGAGAGGGIPASLTGKITAGSGTVEAT